MLYECFRISLTGYYEILSIETYALVVRYLTHESNYQEAGWKALLSNDLELASIFELRKAMLTIHCHHGMLVKIIFDCICEKLIKTA